MKAREFHDEQQDDDEVGGDTCSGAAKLEAGHLDCDDEFDGDEELDKQRSGHNADKEEAYRSSVMRLPNLKEAEERSLALRWREQGDRAAANKLITAHLKLVEKIAATYWRRNWAYGLSKGDLVSEGALALTNAVKSYDPSCDNRFATYAWKCIQRAIKITSGATGASPGRSMPGPRLQRPSGPTCLPRSAPKPSLPRASTRPTIVAPTFLSTKDWRPKTVMMKALAWIDWPTTAIPRSSGSQVIRNLALAVRHWPPQSRCSDRASGAFSRRGA